MPELLDALDDMFTSQQLEQQRKVKRNKNKKPQQGLLSVSLLALHTAAFLPTSLPPTALYTGGKLDTDRKQPRV